MRLGITRPADQLGAIAELAAARGITVVPLPLFKVETVPFNWPPPSVSGRIDWLVFTSANAVHSFFENLRRQNCALDSRLRIAAIGVKTAAALTPYGPRPDYVNADGYGESLFTELAEHLVHPRYTLVYARAEEITFDPESLLRTAMIEYIPLICYRTVPDRPDRNIVDEFSADDYILFTAPSTVRQYQQLFGPPAARVVAIGRTTGSAMEAVGWTGAVALPRPEIETVLECLT